MANEPIDIAAYGRFAQEKKAADDLMAAGSEKNSAALTKLGATYQQVVDDVLNRTREMAGRRKQAESDVNIIGGALKGGSLALPLYAATAPAAPFLAGAAGGFAALKSLWVTGLTGQSPHDVELQQQIQDQVFKSARDFPVALASGDDEIDRFLKSQQELVAESGKQLKAARTKLDETRKRLATRATFADDVGENEVQELKDVDARKLENDVLRIGLKLYSDLAEAKRRTASTTSEEPASELQQRATASDSVAESERKRAQITLKTIVVDQTVGKINKEIIEIQEKRTQTSVQAQETTKKQLEAANRANQRQKAALEEINKTGEKIFDSFGNAFTELAVNGGDAAETLRKVFVGALDDIQREVIKLAAINPLKNAVFGSNLPTLFDLPIFGGGSGSGGGVLGTATNGASLYSALGGGSLASLFGGGSTALTGIAGTAASGGGLVTIGGEALALPEIIGTEGVAAFEGVGSGLAGGSGLFGAGGALAGALPWVGAGLAAVSLLSGLFGKKPSVGPGGQLTGIYGIDGYHLVGAGADNGYNASVNQTAADAIGKAFQKFATSIGAKAATSGQYTIGYDAGTKKYIGAGAYDSSVHGTFENQDAASQAALFYAIKGGDFAGASDRVREALGKSKATDVAGLKSDADFATWYDGLGKAQKATSDYSEKLKTLTETTETAKTRASEFGWSLQPIVDEFEKGKAALADAVRDNLDRMENSLDGKGYLNSVADLAKQMEKLRAESSDAGLGLDQVNRIFAKSAQQIVDNAKLTGSAFDELIRKFPELAGIVHAWGQDITTRVHAQLDAPYQALLDAQQKTAAAKSIYVQAINAELSAYAQARDSAQQFAATLTRMFNANLLGQYSPLAPEDKFAEAQRQFRTAYAAVKANPTDARAQENFQQAQQAYLEANSQFWSSANPAAFQEVQSALQDVAAKATAQADYNQQQVVLLTQQLTNLGAIATGVQTIADLTRARVDAGNAYNTAVGNQNNAQTTYNNAVTGLSGDALKVNEFYKKYLDRDADPGGLAWQLQAMGQGLSLADIERNILGSAEYKSRHPGFANGGSFTVGGWGGVDSTLVQFRATPGERVRIRGANDNEGAALLDELRSLRTEMTQALRRLTDVQAIASDRNQTAQTGTADAVRAVRRELRVAGVRR